MGNLQNIIKNEQLVVQTIVIFSTSHSEFTTIKEYIILNILFFKDTVLKLNKLLTR